MDSHVTELALCSGYYRIFSNLIRTLFTVLEMRITIACGLDSRSRAGFWKNDGAAVRAIKTIQ